MANIQENIAVSMRLLFDAGGFRQAQKAFQDLQNVQKTGIGLTDRQIQGIARTKQEFSKLNSTTARSKDIAIQNKNALSNMFTGIIPKTAKFGDVLRMSTDEWVKFNKSGQRFQSRGAIFANKFRMMTQGLRGFRMEMLGVMFFGMAMANMFKTMLAPATESLGITQLWSTMLQIVFLPIMLLLLPVLLKFMTFFMELPEGVQLAIGAVAVFGMILGKMLFIIGTLTLGLGAMWGTSIPATLAKMGSVAVNIFSGITLAGMAVFAILTGIVIGFFLAWKDNFGGIKLWVKAIWESIKNIFMGSLNAIIGVIKIFVGLSNLNWDLIGEGWKQMWFGIVGFTKGIVGLIISIAVTIGLSIIRVIVGIINVAIGLINRLLPGDMKINTIDTKGTNFEREVRQASNVEVNQTINLETTEKTDNIFDKIKQANEEWMREISRNGASGG